MWNQLRRSRSPRNRFSYVSTSTESRLRKTSSIPQSRTFFNTLRLRFHDEAALPRCGSSSSSPGSHSLPVRLGMRSSSHYVHSESSDFISPVQLRHPSQYTVEALRGHHARPAMPASMTRLTTAIPRTVAPIASVPVSPAGALLLRDPRPRLLSGIAVVFAVLNALTARRATTTRRPPAPADWLPTALASASHPSAEALQTSSALLVSTA